MDAMPRLTTLSGLLAAALACGGGPHDAVSVRIGSPLPTPPGGSPATIATPDPCILAPLTDWKAITGLDELAHSRAGASTCDVLDDGNARVAGSVSVLTTSVYDAVVAGAAGEPVDGLGDAAYWARTGAGLLYVRQGDRALSVMVNPQSTEDHRAAAIALARTALQQ